MASPSVPCLFPNGTVLCIGGGPSLTQQDIDFCHDKVDAAIAINNAYQRCPWAVALYAADRKWWDWHKGVPEFAGLKYSLQREAGKWPGVQVLQNTGEHGLETHPTGLRTGRNSGYQAINLAIHMGATKILLLGYDLKAGPNGESHWHGDHPDRSRSPYQTFIARLETLPPLLAMLGVSVVNCSRSTALDCFPKVSPEEALAERAA